MSTERKEILRGLLADELAGKNFRRQAEYLTDAVVDARAMNAKTLTSIGQVREENRVLDTKLTEYQNLEQAVCPPDMGFKDYFESLESRISFLEAENLQLKRQLSSCEQSKKESAPPPPTQEPTKEDEVKDEEPTEEPESCTESETASEGEPEGPSEEEWEAASAEEVEEGDKEETVYEAVKAMVAVIQEGGLPSQSAEKLDFQALLDEALKG